MNHQSFTANVGDTRRQGQARHHHIQLGHTLRVSLQSWQVACVMGCAGVKTVVMAVRVEMPTGARRIWRRAIPFVMHMKPVLCARFETADLPLQAHPTLNWRQLHVTRCTVALGWLQQDTRRRCHVIRRAPSNENRQRTSAAIQCVLKHA